MSTRLVVFAAVIATTLIAAPARAADLAGAEYRYSAGRTVLLGFDRRPALSQRQIGTLSLEMLAAGADAALAEEAWNSWGAVLPAAASRSYGPYGP